ncbi:MAG: M14 family zinc carboxypeptidase [Clostridia bacterium]|nr:M14 family zinc carboxypeptidase [Clostridia bacterium]
MALMTGFFPGGDCNNIELYDDRIECTPALTKFEIESGTINMHYNWRCRIIGKPGERVHVIMHWPPYDPEKSKKEHVYWFVQSFGLVAERAMYISEDEIHWKHFTDVKKTGFDFDFTVTLPESGRLSAAVNIPFSVEELEALCAEYKDFRVKVAETRAGFDIPAFRFGNGKKVIWLQANVHTIEVSGSHALVGAMRYLKAHIDEIKDYSFFVIPSVTVDGLYGDMARKEQHTDINRDWGKLTNPENINIDRFIRGLAADGYEMLVMTDMHNGWCDPSESGGNLTEFNPGQFDDDYQARRLKFQRAMLAACDFEKPETFWWHDKNPNGIECFFDYGSENYHALCTTMEFSRFEIWDRASESYVPVTQELLEKMGTQYADFLLHYKY